MAVERVQRRLAAIAMVDVVGYSRLMEADEAGTLSALKQHRKTVLDPVVRTHGGSVVKVMGDGVLIEFASAVNAVDAAVDLQARMAEANLPVSDHRRILLRIGINLGDVIGDGSDIYGEGVNVAARLEKLTKPGGICVSAKVHEELRGRGNHSFVDLGDVDLKNIARPVRVYRVESGSGQVDMSAPAASPVTLKPSIAVLPFDNLSGDASQQYLSDGITEDITTELSRFRTLTVAARHASFHLAGQGSNPVQAARELGMNYVVEGSVRRAGDRIRVTAQLIDAGSGSHVWAEKYDRDASDIFAVQDEVVTAIVATVEGRMVAAAAMQTRRRPTSSWTAYDFFLQGRELADAGLEKESVPFFSRAVTIDPDFAQAHAWLALGFLGQYWFDADRATLDKAFASSQRALEIDGNDPTVHHANGMVLLWMRRHERAGLHFDRAVSLNPADLQIRADRANWLRYCGRLEEALAAIDDALQRSPFPPRWFWLVRGGIQVDMKRYGGAVQSLDNMPQKNLFAWLLLAASHAQLGHAPEAGEALARVREASPDIMLRYVTAVVPHARNDVLENLLEGLRKAGLD